MRQPFTVVFASVVVALSQTTAFANEVPITTPVAEASTVPAVGVADAVIEQTPITVTVVDLAEGHDLTAPTSSLWDRVRFGFAMPDCTSPLVAEHLAYYLNRPEHITRMLDRSRRYLYHVVEEVEKRGLPTEIALLPMIESAYNPTALSSARASGIWQFIPSTGRVYGLDQNTWYDERRDVLQATQAALDYLEKLYEMFGSWDLALAAYNAGEGSVSRAIARNEAAGLPTDYVNLPLPSETRNYVPKLQAVKQLVVSPQRYGIAILDIPNRPYFSTVSTGRQMDAEVAARLAGIPLSEFLSLNPAYNRPVLMPEDSRPVLVPADKLDQFATNLLRNQEPLVTWQTYRVSRKDRIDRVAARFGMSAGRLAEVNRLSVGARLYPGQTLLVQAPGQGGSRVDELGAVTLASLGFGADEPTPSVGRSTGKRQKITGLNRSASDLQRTSVKGSNPAATKQAARSRGAKPPAASKKTLVARAGR
jgi:membrane-bound lytic murein transglycosylase D